MKKMRWFESGVGILLLGIANPVYARVDIRAYLAHSENMAAYDWTFWKGPHPSLEGFYPLGFSKEGWFAFTRSPDGPISITNIGCKDACVSDAPSFKGDLCWCPIETKASDLPKFHIQPSQTLERGTFPATFQGRPYHVEIVENPHVIGSEMATIGVDGKAKEDPLGPGAEVFLVSEKARTRIGLFDPNHEGVKSGSVQVSGWIKDPFHERIVVIVGYIEAYDPETPKVVFVPLGTNLSLMDKTK